jgi:8-oxo-dGTP pyrophosphatase MutT (NUDIX family)
MKSKRQVGALPVRRRSDGSIDVLLVTSRETGRWIIPKVWSEKSMPDRKAARLEASEEAGVEGDIARTPVGNYDYFKRLDASFELMTVTVFVLWVNKERARWREKNARQRKWFSVEDAASTVVEPGLATMILGLAGRDTPPKG